MQSRTPINTSSTDCALRIDAVGIESHSLRVWAGAEQIQMAGGGDMREQMMALERGRQTNKLGSQHGSQLLPLLRLERDLPLSCKINANSC